MKLFICLVAVWPALAMASLAGGKTDVTGSIPLTHEAVLFAVEKINAMRVASNQEELVLEDIVKVEEQVVNGMNYFFRLGMNDMHQCKVAVNFRERTDDETRLSVVEEPLCLQVMPGSEGFPESLPADRDHPVYEALEVAICTADERNGMDFASRLADDTSSATYTTQVTYGFTYRFHNVLLTTTDCPPQNCDNINTSSCGPNEHDMVLLCDLSIQVASWDPNPYTVFNTTCHPMVG